MAPRDKKSNMSPDDDDDLKRKMNFFKRKFLGFKKKATQLSVLCGNSVAFICHGPDNDLHVWPEPQDNPHAIKHIVDKFNALSDHTRKHHACDLSDFPDLKGLSGHDLRNHLDKLDSHLVGIRKHKTSLIRRNKKKPKPKEKEEDDRLIKVSDNNTTISNRNLSSSEGQRLGFGGKSDELGYIFRGSHETVSNLGSCAASKVSRDVGVSDSSLPDFFTLGFSGGDYFPMEFPSTLFTGYDPLLGAIDSLSEDQNNTQLGFGGMFDELGCIFRGSQETVSNLGSCVASKVSRDVGVSDSSLLDPFTLGFSGGDYFPVDPMPATDNLGVCANSGDWDLSWKDLEFSSTLFTGYDPLLGATNSSSEDQNNTQLGFDGIFDELGGIFRLPPVTDNLGSIF